MKSGLVTALVMLGFTAAPTFAQQAPAAVPPTTHGDRGGVPILEPLELQPSVTGPTLRDGASVLLEPHDALGLEYSHEVDNTAHNFRLLPAISLTIPFTGPGLK